MGISTGPIGWVVLGSSKDSSSGLYTFDCWKPVLHDYSAEPSNGRFLRDVVVDPRIKNVSIQVDSAGKICQFILENTWNESFNIEFFHLIPSNQLAAHARRVHTC